MVLGNQNKRSKGLGSREKRPFLVHFNLKVLGYTRSDNAFLWVSAHISSFNIGAPIEYAHSILHVSYLILRAIPAIHEIDVLREVLC